MIQSKRNRFLNLILCKKKLKITNEHFSIYIFTILVLKLFITQLRTNYI